jgi:Homeodomain-like domain
MGWTQLNLRVKEETKEALRKLCDEQGISFAQALQSYVEASDRAGYLLASSSNSIDDNASKNSILDATTILEKLERLEKDRDRISLLEQQLEMMERDRVELANKDCDRLAQLEEKMAKIEGGNIGGNTGELDQRFEALEQKLEQVLADRDNLLLRIADQQNQHLAEIKLLYKDANNLTVKLESENYQLEKLNTDLDRQNQFLEAKLQGIPITDPVYVTNLEIRLQALERQAAIAQKDRVQGISTVELAKTLGVNRTTISRWRQSGDPRLENWQSIDGKWYPSKI